jgi:hypothetical protein
MFFLVFLILTTTIIVVLGTKNYRPYSIIVPIISIILFVFLSQNSTANMFFSKHIIILHLLEVLFVAIFFLLISLHILSSSEEKARGEDK